MSDAEKKPTFRELMTQYRSRLGLSMRRFAEKTGISAQYISELENGYKTAPENEMLDKIVKALNLSHQEESEIYDTAASERVSQGEKVIPQDARNYIVDNPIVVRALRTAKDGGAGLAEWEAFIAECEKKNKN